MRKLNFLIPLLFFFIVSKNISAQNIQKQSWNKMIYVNSSLISPKSDWSLSHPVYQQTGGFQNETITGTFKQCIALNGGKRNMDDFQNGSGSIKQFAAAMYRILSGRSEDLR